MTPREPVHIPVAVGLLGASGQDLPLRLEGEPASGAGTRVLELKQAEQQYVFVGVYERPVPSLLREFSAQVKIVAERSRLRLGGLPVRADALHASLERAVVARPRRRARVPTDRLLALAAE